MWFQLKKSVLELECLSQSQREWCEVLLTRPSILIICRLLDAILVCDIGYLGSDCFCACLSMGT